MRLFHFQSNVPLSSRVLRDRGRYPFVRIVCLKEERAMNNQPDPRMQGYQQPANQDNQVPDAGPPYRAAASDSVRSSNVGGAYSQSERESYVDPMGNRVENQAEVFEDTNQSRANTRYWIATIT